jgi:hypothetical protein
MPLEKTFMARLLGIDESEITDITGRRVTLNREPDASDFQSLIHDRVRKRYNALVKVLTKEDDLGRVIRAHIYIEHELRDFIFFAAPNPEFVKRFDGVEFSEKVHLALLLGLNRDLRSALSAMGNLRNKFAHALDMKIKEEEVKSLIATLPPVHRDKLQFLWRRHLSEAEIPVASVLTDLRKSTFRAKTRLLEFFLVLFECVAEERHRVGTAKLKHVVDQMGAEPSVSR